MSNDAGLVERLRLVIAIQNKDLYPGERLIHRDVLEEAASHIQRIEAELAEAVKMMGAVKTLLYSDQVFVGSHWEGDFRDPKTTVWPAFCIHVSNYGSDAEEIPEVELVPLAELLREFGEEAVAAWACHKRGYDEPIKGRLGPRGQAALDFLSSRTTQGKTE